MDVVIISCEVDHGIVRILAVDVSDQNLRRLERLRDDASETIVEFVFDTVRKGDYLYLRSWLKSQKAARQARTWGEALAAVTGSITTISTRYRNWQ